MDNLEQSELSHIYWLDYVSEFEERWGRTPDESHRMTWKAAFRSGASAVRNKKTAPELFAALFADRNIPTDPAAIQSAIDYCNELVPDVDP